MRILGIDYGKKKVGVAIATSMIAAPYRLIRYSSGEELVKEIKKIVEEEKIEEIVVGVSEGEMGKISEEFGKDLEKKLNLPVSFQDETLTTIDAQILSIESKMKRKKRKELEDVYSAVLILQRHLENI